MKYTQKNGGILLTGCDSFRIGEVLSCGQCFRFTCLGEGKYSIVAQGKVLYIAQSNDMEQLNFYPCTAQEFEEIWLNYFDLEKDYGRIKARLSDNDPVMAQAVAYAGGIRLLNQDPWECMISFIISQNNHIPRIKGIIKNIARAYGRPIDGDNYAFPQPAELRDVTPSDYMALGAGFRGKYIADAVDKVLSGALDLKGIASLETRALKEKLLSVHGIGPKVADCVLLFSYGRREVFPTDVWVKRIMEYFYFDQRDVPVKEIHAFAKEKWGDIGGYAQQYLFHFARQEKIGA